MVTETKALANSLDAPSGAEREEIILIIPDKWETRQGMKCTRGKIWGEAEKIAINRVRWKAMVEALCLTRG